MRRIELQHCLTSALVIGVILLVAIGSGAMSAILYGEIVRGFERKMVVIATSVASFLDANRLKQISNGREIVAMSGTQDRLFGVGKDGVLYEIKPNAFGIASPLLQLPSAPGQHPLLARNEDGLIYSPNEGDPRRWAINISTQEIKPLPDAESPARFLMNPGGTSLRLLQPSSDHPLNRALSVTWHGNELLALMPPDAAAQSILVFREIDKPASRVFLEKPDPFLKSIASVGDQLFGAGNKLYKLSANGVGGDFPTVPNFADNGTAEYLEYRQPLLEVHRRCEVTYLYAFGLGRSMGGNPSVGSDIFYIVDAVTDPAWLPIGYEETLPVANRNGILAARAEGRPFISEIMDYGLWGELKVSSAAVDKPEDHFPSMAGCDINVATIRSQTRRATFLMLGAGALTLIASLAVAYKTSRVIIQPLLELQHRALSWATGDTHRPFTVPGHGVLGRLADRLEAARQRTVAKEEALIFERIKELELPLKLDEEDRRWLAKYLASKSEKPSRDPHLC